MNEDDTLKAPLWGITVFPFQTSCIYFKECVDCNILCVNDLVNKTGVLKSENELHAKSFLKQANYNRTALYL